jgi:hypothetical protein
MIDDYVKVFQSASGTINTPLMVRVMQSGRPQFLEPGIDVGMTSRAVGSIYGCQA